MSIDVLTLVVGFISFGIFLLVSVITFRWLRPEEILKSLSTTMMAIAILPAIVMGILCVFKLVDISLQAWVCASLLAMWVQGLLCFVYVLCVFGPYETSVRMRLVREIAMAGSQGISLPELSQAYNHETMVSIRLRRLKGSGDIIEQNGLYVATNKGNIFFLFDAMAATIKKWIGQ